MNIEIQISPEALALVERMGRFPGQEIAAAMDLQNELTVGHIQAERLSKRGPETLGVVTNRLRSSIRPTKASVVGQSVVSAIGTNVVYAGVHELGSPPRTITAKNTKALRFIIGGQVVFAKKVEHPGFPARAPIRRGIEDRTQQYGAAIGAAIVAAWEGEK